MKYTYVGVVEGEIIAFHDKKKVMTIYLKNYKESNPTEKVSLCRMKKKEAREHKQYQNYWLVPCNETYVQQKYEHILAMNTDYQEKEDLIYQLQELLEKTKRKKDQLIILDTIRIVHHNKERCGTYTPSLRILDDEYWRYEQYRTNVYDYI